MVMNERATAAVKPAVKIKTSSMSQSQRTERHEAPHSPLDQILFLQRAIGNQAVQSLFKSRAIQTKFKTGKRDTIYRQAADPAVDGIMRMPNPAIQPKPT
jgi:hypothetical protein